MFNTLDKGFENVEFGIGAISCVPGGNVVAATIRGFLSSAQIVGGSAGAAINYGRSMFKRGLEARDLETSATKCMEYVGHGLFNLLRAPVELIGAGPLLFVGYDLTRMAKLHDYKVLDFTKSHKYDDFNVFGTINRNFEDYEFVLGMASLIPIVRTFTSANRAAFGIAQVVGGAVGYLVNRGASFIVSDGKAAELKARSFKCGQYVGHGICNVVRAPFEAIGAGFIIVALYDVTAWQGFHNKVINYNSSEIDYVSECNSRIQQSMDQHPQLGYRKAVPKSF